MVGKAAEWDIYKTPGLRHHQWVAELEQFHWYCMVLELVEAAAAVLGAAAVASLSSYFQRNLSSP
jgi:hypothetical protein